MLTSESLRELSGKIVTLTDARGDKYTGVLTCIFNRGKVSKVRIGQVGFGPAHVPVEKIAEISLK